MSSFWGTYLGVGWGAFGFGLHFLASEQSVLGPRLPSTISDLCEILDEKNAVEKNQSGNKFLGALLSSTITALFIFQSDMNLGVFAISILDSVRLGLENVKELSSLSTLDQVPSEIMRSWSNRKLQYFISLVSKASESALDDGLHPGLQFLRDVQYFIPETSLQCY